MVSILYELNADKKTETQVKGKGFTEEPAVIMGLLNNMADNFKKDQIRLRTWLTHSILIEVGSVHC